MYFCSGLLVFLSDTLPLLHPVAWRQRTLGLLYDHQHEVFCASEMS